MKLRTTAVVAVSAAALLAAVTGCSTSSSTSGSSSTSATTKTAAAAAKTYSADDLTTVLTKAEKTLGVTDGKILDNATVQATIKKAGGAGGLSSLLSQSGVTIQPAACADEFKKLSVTPSTNYIGSDLTYGSTVVGVLANDKKPLGATFNSSTEAQQNDALAKCSTMSISVQPAGTTTPVAIALKLAKGTATTNAEKTYSIDETLTLPAAAGGTTATITTITAVQGNLLITATSTPAGLTGTATDTTAPSPSIEDAVNAVVAAAK
ncbi:hypothetical protein [Frondihabitans cladoniiphilus]|uniref:Lipoprotein n=1 Tax=Frondihabitans cladoniiphilus TaxID=715785 RepID=A0ABP8W8Z6_9MICO